MAARHKKDNRDQVMRETRQMLLQAAAEEFAREGYNGANVNRIANVAGYAIGTFYNYFPTKRELMLAFIDETGKMHVDFIMERVKQEIDPRRRMEAFYQAGFAFVEAHVTKSRAIFNTLNGPDEEFKLRLYQAYLPLFQMLGDDILRPGITQGIFREIEPESTAGLLMLIYLGTASQLGPEGKPWLDHKQVVDFVLHSLTER